MTALAAESFGRCGECTKIEEPMHERRCHPNGGNGCATTKAEELNFNSSDFKGKGEQKS